MKIVTALCGGASLLVLASAAQAQNATASADQSPEVVVVTGSRVIVNGYAAPTPLTVVPAEQLQQLAPSTIPDALNKLPVFDGSTVAQTGANGSAVAGNYLNLRDFGINRTLILMNGLRMAPTNFNGQVDVNSIPEMLLQRVDVVTGGASAVYGSDGVTGVVNFIMDTNFNGVKADAEVGDSEHGDSGSVRYGIAAGGDVYNLGHIEVSYEHFQEGGLLSYQRGYDALRTVYSGTGSAANPYTLTNYAGLAKTAFGGYALTGPFAGQQFLSSGQLGSYTSGAATGTATLVSGGDAAYYNNEPLTVPQNENQVYGRFDHDFGSDLTAYLQFSDTWSHQGENASNWPQQTSTFFSGNPFLPSTAQSALTAAHAASFTAAIFPRDLELLSHQNDYTAANSITAGVNGRIFGDYNWQASYTHGTAEFHQQLSNNINTANYLAAIDAISGPNGPECYVSTTASASLYPGCAPLDVFGAGNESTAAENFIFQPTQWKADNGFDDFNGSITGSPFSDWAGPVTAALSAEYRLQSLVETTSANPLAPTSFTGLRDVPIPPPGSDYAYATVAPTHAANNVWEVAGETLIPLAKDMPFAKSLEVNAAARYTDYSTSGTVWTWKAGLDYLPIDDIRFRATESRDIRAPTLYDMFAGQSSLVQNLSDPHTGVSRVVSIITKGDPNLVPEVSQTTTAGVILSPSWLPDFRMSVDYYDITMNNAITSLAGNNATLLAQCEAVQWQSSLCSTLIVRPLPFSNTSAANFPTTVYSESFNIAKNWTNGVDVEASYNLELADVAQELPGNLGLRLLYNYQPTLKAINFPGAVTTNAAGAAGLASSRLNVMANYNVGPFRLGWTTRYYSPEQRSGTPGQYFANPELSSYTISDLTLNYTMLVDSHTADVFFNVQNLFDVQPQIAPNIVFSGIPGFGNPTVAGNDLIGRYFTVGLRLRY
jgi:iron complex outermembrane receptor protein